jgi:hypothetical protein
MLFADLTAALIRGDERAMAIVAERFAGVLDQAAASGRPSDLVRSLVGRWCAAHPSARQATSAELGRLAGLADLIAAGLVTGSPAAIAAAVAGEPPEQKNRRGRKPATA